MATTTRIDPILARGVRTLFLMLEPQAQTWRRLEVTPNLTVMIREFDELSALNVSQLRTQLNNFKSDLFLLTKTGEKMGAQVRALACSTFPENCLFAILAAMSGECKSIHPINCLPVRAKEFLARIVTCVYNGHGALQPGDLEVLAELKFFNRHVLMPFLHNIYASMARMETGATKMCAKTAELSFAALEAQQEMAIREAIKNSDSPLQSRWTKLSLVRKCEVTCTVPLLRAGDMYPNLHVELEGIAGIDISKELPIYVLLAQEHVQLAIRGDTVPLTKILFSLYIKHFLLHFNNAMMVRGILLPAISIDDDDVPTPPPVEADTSSPKFQSMVYWIGGAALKAGLNQIAVLSRQGAPLGPLAGRVLGLLEAACTLSKESVQRLRVDDMDVLQLPALLLHRIKKTDREGSPEGEGGVCNTTYRVFSFFLDLERDLILPQLNNILMLIGLQSDFHEYLLRLANNRIDSLVDDLGVFVNTNAHAAANESEIRDLVYIVVQRMVDYYMRTAFKDMDKNIKALIKDFSPASLVSFRLKVFFNMCSNSSKT